MHRLTLAVAASLFAVSIGFAQANADDRKALYEALQAEAKKHFDARRAELAKLKTPEDVRKRQEAIRAKFLESLGGFPGKTPLNAKATGTLKGDGFHVEKVVYESRPHHHVTGLVYVPEGKGPFPGVLIPCGHSVNGKSAEAYQRVCILLAKYGFVVLCYDPIGQGERYQFLDRDGKPAIASSTNEHTLIGIGAWLVGQSTASYRIWDGIRSLDYLASRPDVDAKKLGCAGNSGGGTLTAYLMAIDDRIAAAVPSCYITSLERLFATIGPQDAEQNILGQVAFGMEHADFALLRAPRPTLFAVATRDFFDIDGAWTAYREASKYYSILGHSERMAISEYDDTHGFSKPRREATLRWMRRWLQGIDDAPKETAFPVFKDAEQLCTRSGQVLEEYKGISAYQLSAKAAADMAPQREIFSSMTKGEQREQLRNLLRIKGDRGEGKLEQLAQSTSTRIPPDIKLPFKRFDVVVHEGPVDTVSDEHFKRVDKIGQGYADFVFVSPRGMSMPAATGKPRYFSHDFGETMLSLHLDRPLLGQRVQDVLAAIDRLPANIPVRLFARGKCGPIALHAAALSDRVQSLHLTESLISWHNVTQTPASIDQIANVVPGVLKVYDLPQLLRMMGDREVTIERPVDAAGRALSAEDANAFYEPLRKSGVKLTLR